MSEKFAFILAQKAVRNPDGSPRYQIKQMCRWLQVSTSGFHDWVGRGLSPTQAWRHELGLIIDHWSVPDFSECGLGCDSCECAMPFVPLGWGEVSQV